MNIKTLYTLSAGEIAGAIKKRKLSARDVALACCERIAVTDKAVRAWTFWDKKTILDQARQVDQNLSKGKITGILTGVPAGIKDIFNTYDMPTEMGSRIWKGFVPGNDSRVVFNLRQAQAVIMGKTVTAEFAVHEPGPTRNPYNLDYYPGTSSSGSAVAVATGMVPIALGTQTAGSIIRPASYCGVYGFKPTFGLIPRTGVLKTNDTLDQIGWFARSIADIRLVFDAVRVTGPNYPYVYKNIDIARPSRFQKKTWKVAFVEHPKWEYADSYAKEAFHSFKEALCASNLCKGVSKKLHPSFQKAHDMHDIIYNKTLSYYFSNEYEEYKRKHLISKTLCDLIESGKAVSLSCYHGALKDQAQLRDRLESFFSGCDFIITLSTSGEAPKFSVPVDKPDSCLIWNLCGAPAISVPLCKGPRGLPFGMQIIARRYNDISLFNFLTTLCDRGFVRSVAPVDTH